MKATEAKLLSFLQQSPQFVVPIYQRTYSWGERECRQIWNDILRAGREPEVTAHFVGSIVYVEKGLYSVSSQSPLLVIDGQQRLTTMTLLLEALARVIGDGEPVAGFSAKKLRSYYLQNPLEDGDDRFKLLLSQTDKDSLIALVEQRPLPADHSIRIEENFEFFQAQLAEADIATVCHGIAKLVLVDISLNRDQDNPQLIFESLNSTGRELSQADLIRNYVLMGLDPVLQTELYRRYWRPMELAFGQERHAIHFDGFMRHYLTVKTGEIPKVREVYEGFKEHAKSFSVATKGVEVLVADIHQFAAYYCAIALGQENDAELSRAFEDIRELKVDTAYPFFLEVYHDHQAGLIDRHDFVAVVRLIESYVFRRAICEIPTNSLNKTFATFAKSLEKTRYLESVRARLSLLPSYRRFPSDQEFHREIQRRDLYHFPRRSYWLRRMENHDRKERIAVDEYTIEHILPQNENVPRIWQVELGQDWQRVRDTWLHTLGNLTLTAYNSELSDRSFGEKKIISGGFAESPLRMNAGLVAFDRWDEAAIRTRAERLADKAGQVWASPRLPRSVLVAYRPAPARSAYTIDDHPYLANPAIRDLFDGLRKEVLALDPCITEEFFKIYIAYKAETNFVDVVPQASRLRLSLNMRFPEIVDSKHMCKDVTNLGRWGNGDVEVALSSLEELPYVMGLVRQSLELQMQIGGES